MIQVFVNTLAVERRLKRMQGRFARWDEVLGELENKFITFAKKQFATEGQAGGEKWEPLAPRTVAMKSKKGTLPNGVLRDTMEMYRMLTDKNTPLRQWRVTAKGAQVEFMLPRFKFHQVGTKRMPARPVYPDPLPDSFIRDLKNTITGFVVEGFFA